MKKIPAFVLATFLVIAASCIFVSANEVTPADPPVAEATQAEEAQTEPAQTIAMPEIKGLSVNKTTVALDVNAYFNENKILMIPLRFAVESLGFEVAYDDAAKGVTITSEKFATIIFIGKNAYSKGEEAAIELSAAPVIKDDRTMVPADFFEKILGKFITITNEGILEINNDAEATAEPPKETEKPTETETPELENVTVIEKSISVGENFTVTLDQNPTTGYKWTHTITGDGLKLISDQTFAREENTLGSPSIRNMTFQGLAAGEYEVKFVYNRNFLPLDENPITQVYKVTVK